MVTKDTRETNLEKAKLIFANVLPQLSDLSLARLLGFCEGLAQQAHKKGEEEKNE